MDLNNTGLNICSHVTNIKGIYILNEGYFISKLNPFTISKRRKRKKRGFIKKIKDERTPIIRTTKANICTI